MYSGIVDRSASYDLNLSPREAFQLQESFGDELRRLCSGRGGELPNSLWKEVGQAALARAKINTRHERSIVIAADAKIWKSSPADVLARLRVAQRDASVAGSAGYLVATDNISFTDMLRNRMVAFRMGATRMSGLQGNCTLPKQTVGATAYWLASEDTAITEGNQTFVQIPMVPRTVGAYTQISRLLQLQSAPDAQQLILSDLAQQVALAADLAVIAGTGTEQPTKYTTSARRAHSPERAWTRPRS